MAARMAMRRRGKDDLIIPDRKAFWRLELTTYSTASGKKFAAILGGKGIGSPPSSRCWERARSRIQVLHESRLGPRGKPDGVRNAGLGNCGQASRLR